MQNTKYVSQSLDAYIIPHGDSHQNEYVGSSDQRLAFVSGFTGSAALATVFLSQEDNQKDLIGEADDPSEAWKLLEDIYEPKSRARIAALRNEFFNLKKKPGQSMGIYLSHLQQVAKMLKNAGKEVPEDEIAYQMIANLPSEYDIAVQQIYQLKDSDFKPEIVRTAEEGRISSRHQEPVEALLSKERRPNAKPPTKEPKKLVCFRCETPGHFARNCHKPPLPQKKIEPWKERNPKKKPEGGFLAEALVSTTSGTVEFVIDTGATEHFCNDRTLFTDYEDIPTQEAAIAEGTTPIVGRGTAIVSRNQAALWTDGRYFLQAGKQLDDNWTLMKEAVSGTPTHGQFLNKILPVNGCVGVDALLTSFDTFQSLSSELKIQGHTLLPIEKNLVDEVWADKPPRHSNAIENVPIEYCGKTWQQKVEDIRREMEKENASVVVVTALDEIAWLFNLRGSDIEFNPIFYSYAIITKSSIWFFIDDLERLSSEAKASLENGKKNLTVAPYGSFSSTLQDIVNTNSNGKIWIKEDSSYSLVKLIPEKDRLLKDTSICLSKAIKNEQEIKCARNAHIKDAAALCEFHCWLSKSVSHQNITEMSAAEKLESFRKELDNYVGLSFETISGSGPNGAIIHYQATPETDRKITTEEIYLCDSGAHYRDLGTTDVTRTMHFGFPTSYEKMCYTLVLKGHIALSSLIFPQDIIGQRIDSFARQSLWEVGLDYMHGTGHGVGSFLNVHEGPMGIHYRQSKKLVGLQEGMILSIEPGVYLDEKFGIRLENLAVIKKAVTAHKFRDLDFLTFEPLTLVPFDKNLIDPALLTEKELNWLNTYHSTCKEVVGNFLLNRGKKEAYQWLIEATSHLG
ncbi:hypothetical protein JTE90_011440 [Oedothorax gibbosus]|uniref:CCHC-type domain-containing protein n=1 Tax=Oedothorax gibbosus TaxID=931172 RepID=A0AAV6VDB5_9ARAC|nr:hypothetical protein JTE90_011440 [Oedothorax gibbosus]